MTENENNTCMMLSKTAKAQKDHLNYPCAKIKCNRPLEKKGRMSKKKSCKKRSEEIIHRRAYNLFSPEG